MSTLDGGASQVSSRRSRLSADVAYSSKQLNFSDPPLTRALTRYFPLFPLLKTYRKAHMQIVTLFSMFIFALQHWGFLINPHFSDAWGSVMGGVVSKAFAGAQLMLYDPAEIPAVSTPAVILSFDYVVLLAGVVFNACVLFHLTRTEDQGEAKGVTATVARLLLELASTVLFIPILQLAFSSMICDAGSHMWLLPATKSAKCWGPMHIASLVPAALTMVLLLPTIYIRKVCVYECSALSDNFTARRHSILDKLTFFHDLAAAFLFGVMVAYNAVVGYAVLMALNSLVLVIGYVYYLPYYSAHVNRFYVVVHTLEFVAAVFLAAAQGSSSLLAAVLVENLMAGVAVVMVVVVIVITEFRVNPNFIFAMRRTEQCLPVTGVGALDSDAARTPCDGDLKPMGVDGKSVANLPYPKGLVTTEDFTQYMGLNARVMDAIMRQGGIDPYLDGFDSTVDASRLLPVLESYVDSVHVGADVPLAASFLDMYAAKFGQVQVSPMMILFVANIYSRALVTFPDDPVVLQGFTSFIITYLPGLSYMGVDLVKRVLHVPTTVEQQFRAQKQIVELRFAMGVRTHAHSVRGVKARTAHGKVLQSVNRFWEKLTEPTVNMKEVSELADEIATRRQAAVEHFDLALRRQQTADPVLLRRLGEFFAEVLMAPDAANECYEEARDILEARQARSMRGTRAHTAEVDVVALTERLCALLALHSRSTGGSQAASAVSSRMMKNFAVVVTVLFAILLTCSAIFLFVASSLTREVHDVLEATMAITTLQIGASRFGLTLIGLFLRTNENVVSPMLALLASLMDSFAANLEFITTGKGKAQSRPSEYLMKENTIPIYVPIIGNKEGFSLLGLSESFLQGMSTLVNQSATELPSGYGDNEQFLIQVGSPLSDAFGQLLDLQATEEMGTVASRWIIWLVVVYAVDIACLVSTYAALALAFRRTAMTGILTFQLFTLIPYDALERLSTEAKERFHHIFLERSYRRGQDRAAKASGRLSGEASDEDSAGLMGGGRPSVTLSSWHRPVEGGGAVREGAPADAVSPTAHRDGADGRLLGAAVAAPQPGSGSAHGHRLGWDSTALSAPQLRSCLRSSNLPLALLRGAQRSPTESSQPGREPVERRVRFNPIVEVVGGIVEGARESRDAAPLRNGDDEDTAEDIDLLLITEAGTRRAVAKRRETEKTLTVSGELRGTIAYVLLMMLCVVGSTVLLGLTLKRPISYMNGIRTYELLLRDLNHISLRVPRVAIYTRNFIRSGSLHEFQNAQNNNAYIIQGIPTISGVQVPLSVSASLTEMHKVAQLLGNVSIDVSALAAKAFGVSLTYWSDARSRAQMSESALVMLLTEKYPEEMQRVDNIEDFLGDVPINKLLRYAHSIWFEKAATYSTAYLRLAQSVMSQSAVKEMEDARLSRPYLTGVITLSSAAISISLLITFTPLQALLGIVITRRGKLLTAASFLPILVLSIALYRTRSVNNTVVGDEYDISLQRLDTALAAMVDYDGSMGLFTCAALPSAFFAAAAVDAVAVRNALSDVLVSEYGADGDLRTLFARMASSWSRVSQYSNISAALTISAFGGYTRMERPMIAALNASHWDFSIERDYYDRSAEYTLVGQNVQYDTLYTTKENDLQLTPGAQHALALETITSGSYRDSYVGALDNMESMYDRFIDGVHRRNLNFSRRRMGLLYAALASCALPLLACVCIGHTTASAIRLALRVTDASSSKSMQIAASASTSESGRYGTMLSRARTSLFLVALVISATFGVGIWLTQIGYTFTEQIAAVSGRQTMVSSTFYRTRQLAFPQNTFAASPMAFHEANAIATDMATLFKGRTRLGVPVGLFLSRRFNELTFGVTDVSAQMEVATSFMMNNCSRYCSGRAAPLPLVPAPDYGAGLKMPAAQALSNWMVTVMRAVAYLEDMTASSTEVMDQYLDTLNANAYDLLSSLKLATNAVMESVSSFSRGTFTALLVMAALTLILSLAVYLVVVVPTLVRLFREEEALRMLLHMIPTEVRDEVPAISQFMETGQVTNMAALQKKLDANEKLLQNILPQKIAARLKSGEQPIADNHESVTMLFTDFVGFTKRSTTMQAREIVDFLNEVFLEFDTIVELLNLEKIKTIGDAFFMAGGLDPLITDHALRVVEAGIKFFEALEEHNRRHPSRQPLQMRLGIHTGPVVAGVIGNKKVAYDLWGESVEIANALESTGVPGYVHISEETAKYVRGFFRLQPRGPLPREKEHIPESMPATYLIVGRELPTPYMHLRRPRLLPTSFQEKDKEKEKEKVKDRRSSTVKH